MCRIAGALYFDLRRPSGEALKRIFAAMEVRATDEEGSYCDYGMGLVHGLSIIDVSERRRCPMPNETETLRVVHFIVRIFLPNNFF